MAKTLNTIVEAFKDVPKHKLDHDNLTKTFKQLDKKLSILDDETLDWIKSKIVWNISDAFIRGYDSVKQLKEEE